MVIEWCSSEVILVGCLNICFSDQNAACPGTPRPSKFNDSLEHEVTGFDKTSNKQANLKYEIKNENVEINVKMKKLP